MEVRVYPEYYDGALLGHGIEIYGVLTGARLSRMCLAVDGTVLRCYDKIGTDGTNVGGAAEQVPAIWCDQDIAVGLICCMDVQNPQLKNKVKATLDETNASIRVIAICACMTSDWFSSDRIERGLWGYYVAVSNGRSDGVPSFIAGLDGTKQQSMRLDAGRHSIICSSRDLI